MSCDIFISYEIADSSSAYELAAVLARNNMTYHLDCVNSCMAPSGLGICRTPKRARPMSWCSTLLSLAKSDKMASRLELFVFLK